MILELRLGRVAGRTHRDRPRTACEQLGERTETLNRRVSGALELFLPSSSEDRNSTATAEECPLSAGRGRARSPALGPGPPDLEQIEIGDRLRWTANYGLWADGPARDRYRLIPTVCRSAKRLRLRLRRVRHGNSLSGDPAGQGRWYGPDRSCLGPSPRLRSSLLRSFAYLS